MHKVYQSIDKLIFYAKTHLGLEEKNEDYVRNSIFSLLQLDSYGDKAEIFDAPNVPDQLLEEFTRACLQAGLFDESQTEYYCDQVMGTLSLLPKQIEDKFFDILNNQNSKAATEWFYDYSVKNDYVKKSKLDKNIRFERDGLIITINKAKPEFRDPKKAQKGNATKGGYPKCSICHENEGFAGRNKRTLRTVDVTLAGEKFFWQFSPYGYFYQHGIAVNYEHIPMHINRSTFEKLMDFVDLFPHWFIGSNAPLPLIGGSVLAHDHYQGGGELLPMHKAKAAYTLKNKAYKDALVEILDWPGTVIRVVSKNKQSIVEICEKIREKWLSFEDAQLGIIPKDKNGIHSAVSPTVLKTPRGYEMSVILRNNITSTQYPDGVFHAHPEFHVIKKESIGLIEAQGLFILPGRLQGQLATIANLLAEGKTLPEEYGEFKMIYKEIKALCAENFSRQNIQNAIERELSSVCYRILQNTAVFKDNALSVKFMGDLGFCYD